MLPNLDTILTAVAALAAVIGFILVAARFARTRGLPRPEGTSMAVSEVIALDTGRRLHLVRCAGRDVLLLTGGPQDLVVGWLPSGTAEG